MAEKRLNSSQQRAVDIDTNGIITAGAGSGKTTVLALRFLRLVKQKRARVDEILTLTFTRKAAAEMYSRIHKHFTANQSDDIIREELARFDLAQISTLDSFCSQIVRADCARYGIPEDFRLDKPESDRMIEEAAMEFLLKYKEDSSMIRLLGEYGFKRVLQEVWYSLGIGTVSLAAPVDFTALAEKQFEAMQLRVKRGLEILEEYGRVILNLDPSAGKSLASFQEKASEMDGDDLFDRSEWIHLGRLFKEIGAIRTPGRVAKPDGITFKELFLELKPIMRQASGCCSVLENRNHIYRVGELANEFQERLIIKKRSSGLLTFQDVMELAVDILKNNLKLRHHFKTKFKYIMIDEFQDNNRLQKDLLFLLAEDESREVSGMPASADLSADKLYFVGDEKQSIYRFRGADVSVFKGLSHELETCGGEKISLDTNYRSEPELIDFFNEVFPSIMGEGLEDYEAGFQPLGSRESNLKKSPVIKLFYTGDDAADSASGTIPPGELEAFHISRFIRDRVESRDMEIFRDGESRPADYDDFAVLFRSGSNQFVYEKYFRNMGIPYDVSDVRSLFMGAPVNDIYALLQLAVYPEDRNAYAALLRSPFINLGDDSMIRLMLQDDIPPFSTESGSFMIREQDREKIAVGGELFRGVLDRIDRRPLTELLRWIWYDRGYRFTLLKTPAYHHYLEYYDYLSALARSADTRGVTLAGFLDEIRPNLGQNKKLDELSVLKRETSGVRIMTVHASKGLEFPVTILADCGSVGRQGGDKAAPFFFHPELGISLKLEDQTGRKIGNPVYSELEVEEQAREFAELKRVLYVALTRAECHLVLAGRHTSRNQSKINSLLNLFLSGFGWQPKTDPMLIPSLAGIVEPMTSVSREDSLKLMRGINPVEPLSAMNLYQSTPAEPRVLPLLEFPVTGYIESAGSGEKEPVFSEGELFFPPEPELLPELLCDSIIHEKGLESVFGTLCHLILEEAWKNWSIPGRRDTLLTGLSGGERAVLESEAERICRLFLDSSFSKELTTDFSLEPEVSFLLKKEESGKTVFLRGQIDLMCVSPDGDEIRVIDFKTDSHKNPAEHIQQISVYKEAALGMAAPRAGVRGFLCYLRDGSFVEME